MTEKRHGRRGWVFAVACAMTALLPTSVPAGAGAAAGAEPPRAVDPADARILDAFLGHTRKLPEQLSAKALGKTVADGAEVVTWIVCPQLEMLLTAHELTGRRQYLDTFVRCVENLRSGATKGPDGYLGWYGRALGIFRRPDRPDAKIDILINSFRVTGVLARFLELTAANTDLARAYAKQRAAYLDLMENHLVRKWDARGNWVDLGAGGAVYRTHKGLRDTKAHLTQPHNKHAIAIRALLGLYRVTGNDAYAAKAVKLGTRFKRCLTSKDGHYQWHYWDPAGPWDVHPADRAKWKHWIGVEHKGGYYSASLGQAVALYHHGLVFDRTDIGRFVKMQLEVAWNGDAANPKWARCDGTTSTKYQQGAYMCAALAPFSEKVLAFVYTGPRRQERVDKAAHSWQGGPVAEGWLAGKYVVLPAARSGKQTHLQAGRRFLSKEANRRLVESLRLAISPPGYVAPATPDRMTRPR